MLRWRRHGRRRRALDVRRMSEAGSGVGMVGLGMDWPKLLRTAARSVVLTVPVRVASPRRAGTMRMELASTDCPPKEVKPRRALSRTARTSLAGSEELVMPALL